MENSEVKEKKNVVDEVMKIFTNEWNKQVILYGPPGTSKTYSAIEIAAKFLDDGSLKGKEKEPSFHEMCEKFLKDMENENRFKLVQFHPSYSYEDFVRGITVKPRENKSGLSYEVESKIFEKFCNEKKEEKKVLIIDEINRAPLASVLGELIYGLEYRGKNIYTPYVIRDESGKEKPLNIPDNLFIIGTMNTTDRSIGSIDYAVRRRFAFISVPANADIIKSTWDDEKIGEEAENLYKALLEGGEQIEGKQTKGIFDEEYLEDTEIDVEDIKIGHSYFLGENKSKEENDENDYLSYRIKYQVFPIYKEYIKDGIIKKSGEKNFKDICKHHNIDL